MTMKLDDAWYTFLQTRWNFECRKAQTVSCASNLQCLCTHDRLIKEWELWIPSQFSYPRLSQLRANTLMSNLSHNFSSEKFKPVLARLRLLAYACIMNNRTSFHGYRVLILLHQIFIYDFHFWREGGGCSHIPPSCFPLRTGRKWRGKRRWGQKHQRYTTVIIGYCGYHGTRTKYSHNM